MLYKGEEEKGRLAFQLSGSLCKTERKRRMERGREIATLLLPPRQNRGGGSVYKSKACLTVHGMDSFPAILFL